MKEGMLSVDEALARILAHAAPLPEEMVALNQARGRTLARSLAARRTQPPTDVSAMDGYALRHEDLAPVVDACWGKRRRSRLPRFRPARRNGAHLHRRSRAARGRHRADPGNGRGRWSARLRPRAAGAWPQHPQRRARLQGGRTLARSGQTAWRLRDRARRRDESRDGTRRPQTACCHHRDWRRAGATGRSRWP